jgi:replication factor A1
VEKGGISMEIKDVQANQGNIDLVLHVVQKDEPRTFEKFGKSGKVCNAKVKDETGELTLTLWNDDVDKINQGDKIHLQNGWCSEYKGERQVSAGKFGKLEVVEANTSEVFTNDPSIMQPTSQQQGEQEGEMEVQEEFLEE